MEKFEKEKLKDRLEVIKISVPEEVKAQFLEYKQIDKLPDGCAVIGGAARSLAFSLINRNLKSPIPIRDIDVAYFIDEIDQDDADVWAEQFSPDDYVHDHGAQPIEDINKYMDSRDLTMNQVLYKDGKLFVSRKAIHDIYHGVINPCEDRGDWYYDDAEDISTRLALKMILQKTVMEEYVEDIKINDKFPDGSQKILNSRFEINEFYDSSYNGFQLALAIQKAFDYGQDTPTRFLKNLLDSSMCVESESIKEFILNESGEIRDLFDIMTDLNEYILSVPFDFRNSAGEFYFNEANDRIFEEQFSKYEHIEKMVESGGNFRGNMKL